MYLNKNITVIFSLFALYFVEALVAAFTALHLFLHVDKPGFGDPQYLQYFHSSLLNSQALSGWMRSISVSLFSGLSREVQSGSSSLKDIPRLVLMPLLYCLEVFRPEVLFLKA